MESMMKKSSESRTDLNKLQEMLGPLGGNPGDAKVNYFILIPKLWDVKGLGFLAKLLMCYYL